MEIFEIGTGYTPIPARMGAATEIVVEELTKSMIKQNINIRLIDIQTDNRLENNLPIEEVKVPSCFRKTDVQLGVMHKLKRVIYSILLTKKLRKLIANSNNKIVLHFHNQYNLFFFLKLTPQKIVDKVEILYTNHSYIWHGEWSDIEETIKKRYFQEVYCMKNADKIFVLNEQARKNIVENLSIEEKKVFLIDNGVNTNIYNIMNKDKKNSLKEKSNLINKKVFIQVGSICDRKNQLGAIKLLLPMMKKNKDIVFCYAGGIISEEYQEEIKNFAKINNISDRVSYFGELQPGKELNEFYNLADAMVFPSKAEGFSLVIIEAMSAGIPVIINKDLKFKLADKCLKYSDSNDFISIINNKILDDENHLRLINSVRNSVVKEYSWDKVSKDYLSKC
ncbi:glycosyltransferase family 4 protein [Clostridium perfringens]|nr:glycosyltransferase family 4 protein [Clostridium perfringens]